MWRRVSAETSVRAPVNSDVIFVAVMVKREKIVQADTEDGQVMGEAVVEAVENQTRR